MKIYKTQSEVDADIKNDALVITGDVTFECDISLSASIIVSAGDISAGDISAGDISARDISAEDISARDISANDISARDIKAEDISAGDISYYAYCNSYESIKCTSIKGRREKHNPPVCLDGELIIIPKGGE